MSHRPADRRPARNPNRYSAGQDNTGPDPVRTIYSTRCDALAGFLDVVEVFYDEEDDDDGRADGGSLL